MTCRNNRQSIRPRLTLNDLLVAGLRVGIQPDGELAIAPAERLAEWIPVFYAWRNELTAETLLRWPRPIPWRPGVARALARVVRHQVEAETDGLGSAWRCMTLAEALPRFRSWQRSAPRHSKGAGRLVDPQSSAR